jgi:hypothetical protein
MQRLFEPSGEGWTAPRTVTIGPVPFATRGGTFCFEVTT